MQFPSFKNELDYFKQGYTFVAGCDEVGRGPLAGPVVAAACILNPEGIEEERKEDGSTSSPQVKWYSRVRDSKTISEKERESILEKILPNCLAYGIGVVGEEEIDKINIHNASLLAMRRAVKNMFSKIKNEALASRKFVMLIDGRFIIPDLEIEQKSFIKGDVSVLSISAASIIAKVHRDKIMHDLHKRYPEYSFGNNKGYGTVEHKKAIEKFGICKIHRRSFVQNIV